MLHPFPSEPPAEGYARNHGDSQSNVAVEPHLGPDEKGFPQVDCGPASKHGGKARIGFAQIQYLVRSDLPVPFDVPLNNTRPGLKKGSSPSSLALHNVACRDEVTIRRKIECASAMLIVKEVIELDSVA